MTLEEIEKALDEEEWGIVEEWTDRIKFLLSEVKRLGKINLELMGDKHELMAEVKGLQKELLDEQSGNYWGAKQIEELKAEVKRLREVIERVLAWRNLDGDGISDPLRKELYKLLEGK